MPRPLDGLRVIDLGTRIAAPFCAGLLGEQGAEVIKIEQPGAGDVMRRTGPFENGYSLFWSVEGRGRKSVTLNLRVAEGQELFRRLASTADVVCENFRPGTLESWHLGPSDLDSRLVIVRISAFGQDGPKASRRGLDRVGIAYGGLLHLTGYPGLPSVRPGVTVSDYLTGAFCAQAALAALYARDALHQKPGWVIDASLYGSVLRILEWTLAAYDRLKVVRGREGNRRDTSAPLDNYMTSDNKEVCIVASSDSNFRLLCAVMERTDLLSDSRFQSSTDRAANGDEINGIVSQWAKGIAAAVIEERCAQAGLPVATVLTVADIFSDSHMAARGDIVTVDDPVLGPVRQQASAVRLNGAQPAPPSGAPILGQHNEEVWCGVVGLTPDELARFQEIGVV